MSTKLADVRVHQVSAEIVLLGWTHRVHEDLHLIRDDIARYVVTASREGFTAQDMLQDVLDKYRHFFMACGDVDTLSRDGGTTVIFYLRVRKGS